MADEKITRYSLTNDRRLHDKKSLANDQLMQFQVIVSVFINGS